MAEGGRCYVQARPKNNTGNRNTDTVWVRGFLLHLLSFIALLLNERKWPCSPIGAPGGARAKSRASGYKTPSSGGKGRSRAMRSAGSVDPQGLVGRRIWRYYPDENPEQPWVEGFLTDYDTHSQTYTILYDPNDPGLKETTEFGFDLNSTNPVRDIKEIILLKNYVERTLIAVFYVCRVNMF